ncbi:unnamed protein product [Penicillium egyptiacum]|uniref:Protein kinase domain-containing protein n=1 Tax=Penicillium egyptiacum TaxID=1303716 RepID=A0A9W4P0K7_9EURO|nr:unnamed protein product [Penicillium egyptiacum]
MSDNRCTLFPRGTDIASGTGPQNHNHDDSREIESHTDINDNRCTVFPRSTEIGDSEFDTRNISQSQNREVRRLKKRHLPERWLQLPVKRTAKADEPRPKRQTPVFCKDHTPWMKYQKFKEGAKPGKTCLAYVTDSPGMVVAMKEYKTSGIDKTHHLKMISHPNIVNLLDAFEQSRTLYLAYELMDLSLEQLQSGIQLKESDLAFICKELLHGLWYIHRDLGVCHTALTFDNMFISSQGSVKIG